MTAAVFTITKTWKQPKYPMTEEWIKRTWCICTRENYSAKTKNETVPLAAAGMDLEGHMLSDMSQPEKDKYCIIAVKYGM